MLAIDLHMYVHESSMCVAVRVLHSCAFILEVDTAYPLLKIIDFPWLINCQSMMYDIGHRNSSIADVCLPYLEILNTKF